MGGWECEEHVVAVLRVDYISHRQLEYAESKILQYTETSISNKPPQFFTICFETLARASLTSMQV